MDPDVRPPDVNTIQAASVATVNDHVVDLAVGAGVHREVKRGRVHERYVMDAEVRDLDRNTYCVCVGRLRLTHRLTFVNLRILGLVRWSADIRDSDTRLFSSMPHPYLFSVFCRQLPKTRAPC